MSDFNAENIRKYEIKSGMDNINSDLNKKEAMKFAKKKGYPYIDVSKFIIKTDILMLITQEKAISELCIPFSLLGNHLKIAVVNPDGENIKKIKEELEKQWYIVEIFISSENSIKQSLQSYKTILGKVIQEKEFDIEKMDLYFDQIENISSFKQLLLNATAEDFFMFLVLGALNFKASDIHIEPFEKNARLRYRIDGVLHEIFTVNLKKFDYLKDQIKYHSKMKLNIKNISQDGGISLNIKGKKIDLRVSTLPSKYGEVIVMRVLDSSAGALFVDIAGLGFSDRDLQKINQAIKKPEGLILITGPTGSGKTTSLYSFLNQINDVWVNIITIENPVEYDLPGIEQVPVEEEVGNSFSNVLRACFRQDPDIMMVWEIRDSETAQTAIQASITGHLVFSTLHTNSALGAINRLVNIGVEAFFLAPAINLIMAQRIPRRLCSCKQEKNISEKDKTILSNILPKIGQKLGKQFAVPTKLFYPVGCDKCMNTGYKGRIAIVEIAEFNSIQKELIIKGVSENELIASFEEQWFLLMKEDGLLKVLQWLTTIEEVLRVAG